MAIGILQLFSCTVIPAKYIEASTDANRFDDATIVALEDLFIGTWCNVEDDLFPRPFYLWQHPTMRLNFGTVNLYIFNADPTGINNQNGLTKTFTWSMNGRIGLTIRFADGTSEQFEMVTFSENEIRLFGLYDYFANNTAFFVEKILKSADLKNQK